MHLKTVARGEHHRRATLLEFVYDWRQKWHRGRVIQTDPDFSLVAAARDLSVFADVGVRANAPAGFSSFISERKCRFLRKEIVSVSTTFRRCDRHEIRIPATDGFANK